MSDDRAVALPYESPAVVRLGTLRELTLGASQNKKRDDLNLQNDPTVVAVS